MSTGLRAGYKQTEVGVIPEDWEVCPISDLITGFRNGFAFAAHGYVEIGIPIVTMAQIGLDGRFNFREDAVNYWPLGEASSLSAFQLFRGDIIIAMTDVTPQKNLIGRMAEVAENGPLLLNQRVGLLRPDSEKLDPYYLRAISNSSKWRGYARAVASLGVQANIGTKDILAGKIPVPPLPEQRAIAAALSDVDALLAGLDSLIAKKQGLKVAAMQQLLTRQTRLPGFSGEWKVKRLGDMAEMGSGGTPLSSVPAYYDGKIPWVAISDMTKGGKIIESTERNLTALGLANSAAQMFPVGTVLYAMYASLGECSIAGVSLCTSQAILGIRPKNNLSADFLYYYLTSLKSVVKTLGQQGTQANLNKGMVQDFRFSLPAVPEQTAIAAILSDMDTELAALQARRRKTQALKQAMMQELLTGRIRLV